MTNDEIRMTSGSIVGSLWSVGDGGKELTTGKAPGLVIRHSGFVIHSSFGFRHSSFWDYMAKQSSGTLLYRRAPAGLEVLLVHPSGNYNRGKPWSIPKGLPDAGEA